MAEINKAALPQNTSFNAGGAGGAAKPGAANKDDKLRMLNYELAEIYFPLLVVQLKYDIFPFRNRQYQSNYHVQNVNSAQTNALSPEDDERDLFCYQEVMRKNFEQNCKTFFILRDFYLLTRVQVTGTIAYYIKKDEKHFFGRKFAGPPSGGRQLTPSFVVDDSTGIVLCVLWLNQFNQQKGSNSGQAKMRSWLIEQKVERGDTVSILAAPEYWQDQLQLTVHKMRIIRDTGEEMLQYQSAIMAQKVYFEPDQPYERRLFGAGALDHRKVFQEPAYAIK